MSTILCRRKKAKKVAGGPVNVETSWAVESRSGRLAKLRWSEYQLERRLLAWEFSVSALIFVMLLVSIRLNTGEDCYSFLIAISAANTMGSQVSFTGGA